MNMTSGVAPASELPGYRSEMKLPKRREVLCFPTRIRLTEEGLERAAEYLRLEGYQDIRVKHLCVTGRRGSKWDVLWPMAEPMEKPHKIEVSLLEIRYTLDLWYLGLSRKETWSFENEALRLQEYVSGQKMGKIEAGELQEKIKYSRLERYVDFAVPVIMIFVALLVLLGLIEVIAFLLR